MRKNLLAWLAVAVLSLALGAGAVVAIDSFHSNGKSTTTIIEKAPSQVAPASQSQAQTVTAAGDLSGLYSQVRPSVVKVTGASSRSQGVGSGIILDKQGHILTNYHVVSGFTQLSVKLADGTEASAQVLGTDPGDDLAVMKVDLPADKLSPATLGESGTSQIGQQVLAIGNPFELEGTLTEGIVSGLGRVLNGGNGRPLRQLIQSDAAINPGNSGGGLFDMNGNVIGITTALENPSGQDVFVGIGYAVPIDTARKYLPDMINGKDISHARLGVALEDVTPALAQTLGLNVQQGVMIDQVDPSSAAARAGLRGAGNRGQAGDVIVSIDGHDVKTYADLADYIDTRNVGDKVNLKIVRNNQEQTISVTLDAWTS